MLPTDTCCYLLSIDVYIDIICFMFLNNFLTEFLPKCYALLLMAFDCHTIKVYLLTYLLMTSYPSSLSACFLTKYLNVNFLIRCPVHFPLKRPDRNRTISFSVVVRCRCLTHGKSSERSIENDRTRSKVDEY